MNTLNFVEVKNIIGYILRTYRCHASIWPDGHSLTCTMYDPWRSNRRKQCPTKFVDPCQDHAQFGHPVAVVLAMSDGMDDLEVAFQSDDDETQLSTGHTCAYQSSSIPENAYGIDCQLASDCVVHKAAGYNENQLNEDEEAGQKIHDGLVDNQGVDVASKPSPCPH